MKALDTLEIKALGWEDAYFFGFEWLDNSLDLRLLLVHASRPVSPLLCHWASDLRVDLIWHRPAISTPENPLRRGGALLTIDIAIEAGRDQPWIVLMDFGSDGEIRLQCQSITASIADA